MQKILSLYELKPRDRSFAYYRLLAPLCVLGVLFDLSWPFRFPTVDLAAKLSNYTAAVTIAAVGCILIGEGLYAGAFGRRFQRYGQRLWALSQLSLIPIGPPLCTAMGYGFASDFGVSPSSGALIGGGIGLILSL